MLPMRFNRYAARRGCRRGIMLFIVTLALTALILAGMALLTLMKTEQAATMTRGREALVRGSARSAVVWMIGALEKTPQEREAFGGLYNNAQRFCAQKLLDLDEGGDDVSRFTIISPIITDSKIEGVRYGLVDESSRLNLNAVLAWEHESPGAGRDALMSLPGMTAIAADSILDWIDPDEDARQNGGEAKYYADKKLPYSPRNAAPVFLEELLLVRGVTRSQLYGSDERFTYNIEKLETQEDATGLGGSLAFGVDSSSSRRGQGEAVPWKELLTVFSAEKDVDPTGEARVDLNVANLSFLYQELQSRVGEDLAKFVVLYRQYGPDPTASTSAASGSSRARGGVNRRRSGYAQTPATQQSSSATDDPNATITIGALQSVNLDFSVEPTATLSTPLDLVGARVIVDQTAYQSPITTAKDAANIERLYTLLDYASTSASTTIIGRVNVNTAPRAVLLALPGISAADVQKIMSERPDPEKQLPAEYRHATWLYAKDVVDLEQMRALYNKTTGLGDVYRGQIIGFLDHSDEIARAEVVIDGSTVPPRQVFYKDLTSLGKGFADAILLGGMTEETAGLNDPVSGQVNWSSIGQNDIVEIESQRTSGYTSGGASPGNALDDPFAAVEAINGGAPGSLNSTSNDATIGANPALSDVNATLLPSANASNTTSAAPNTRNSARSTLEPSASSVGGLNRNVATNGDANTEPIVADGNADATVDANATDNADASSASAETYEERRERLLQTLRNERAARSERNRSRISANNGSAEEEGQ